MNIVKSKTLFLLVMLVLFSFLLVACNFKTKVKATFTGTIETINEEGNGGLSVNIEEATDTDLMGIVDVVMPDDTTEKFNVGDKVKVGFDGSVFESAPIFVQAITLEKID